MNRPNGQTDSFLAYCQDGKIFRQTPEGPQQIGATSKTYDDLKADYDSIFKTCQEYYDALVKAGIITPEPTQEELLQRQADQLKEQAAQLATASKVIAESAANQKSLTRMIMELRQEVSSLKNANFLGQGEQDGRVTDYIEPVSNIPSVEGTDQPSLDIDQELSELAAGPVSGAGRPQYNNAAASKRPALSAKRPVARHS